MNRRPANRTLVAAICRPCGALLSAGVILMSLPLTGGAVELEMGEPARAVAVDDRSAGTQILAPNQLRIDSVAPGAAQAEAVVTVNGQGFGSSPGFVVLTGRRIQPHSWTDTQITFTVPDDGASGFLAVRTAGGARSAAIPFTVERPLPDGQIAPYGLTLEKTGLPGAAFLVETDGSYLYGISGFETLGTYKLRDTQPHQFLGRVYLNQRVADLRVQGGYLFCVGDHGLLVYRCADLRAGRPVVAAAVAGGSYHGVDVRPDPAGELAGVLVALSEHAPRWGTNLLRVVFYQFVDAEFTPLGTFRREAGAEERQFAVALDPLNRKAYVSGWGSLTGSNKYLLELSTADLASPTLQHREETGALLAGDLDALENVLWAGMTSTALGNTLFQTYTLSPGTAPLSLNRVITGGLAFGRVARVKILDGQVTVGTTWYGNRPDIFLLTTFGSATTAAATRNSLDWAFDVTGYARPAGTNAGKVIVADEWGGFITLDYQVTPKLGLTHQTNYQWVVAAAMTEGLHLAEGRVYVAGRGAGPWSADGRDLANESQWRRVEFDWTQAEPQPHPISAVCTRRDPAAGLLIAALGHEKAMAWGNEIIGLLYRETASNIVLLAQAEAFNPPGSGSEGVSAVWPEPDLVFMATGSDGFRAYVVNPAVPSITSHRDCRASGFATNLYSTALAARCLKHYVDGSNRKLIVGSTPGLLVGSPTLNVFTLSYPDGVPDRSYPDAPIEVVHDAPLECLKWKPVYNLDVRPSGLVAVATSAGVGIFQLAWLAELNQTNDVAAWNRIRVPVEAYAPWWHASWSDDIADVSFADDHTLYVVKSTEGLWRLTLALEATNRTYRCLATAYYPGVNCGMDFTRMLPGWANPDIPTLHNPYGVVTDGDVAYVTGWSGKVQRLTWQRDSGLRIATLTRSASRIDLTFSAPFGDRTYWIETTTRVNGVPWTTVPGAVIRKTGEGTYAAQCPPSGLTTRFYRIGVQP